MFWGCLHVHQYIKAPAGGKRLLTSRHQVAPAYIIDNVAPAFTAALRAPVPKVSIDKIASGNHEQWPQLQAAGGQFSSLGRNVIRAWPRRVCAKV